MGWRLDSRQSSWIVWNFTLRTIEMRTSNKKRPDTDNLFLFILYFSNKQRGGAQKAELPDVRDVDSIRGFTAESRR